MALLLLSVLLLCLAGCGDAGPTAPHLSCLVSVAAGEATGSGVLYRRDEGGLYVLTAAHVVSGLEAGSQAALRFWDGWEVRSGHVASSGTTDIALIWIPAEEMPAGRQELYQCAAWDKESFDSLETGDACTAVGLAGDGGILRHEGSILEAWVYMEDYGQYMIWADAQVEPGMSGGGLLDESGRLIGILSGGSEDGELAAVPLSLILQFLSESVP